VTAVAGASGVRQEAAAAATAAMEVADAATTRIRKCAIRANSIFN
jgi:hypothetical protein